MSLKPLKASDQKKLNARMEKRKKQIEELHQLPPYIYIVSEGTKTEPYYIAGLVDAINEKYYPYSTGKRIIVKGIGRNTIGLLEYARTNVEIDCPDAAIVWLMYDRDDFPLDNFDNTQYSAEGRTDKRKYRVAWSNECIELWFLMHFQELVSDVGRTRYREILEDKINYEKNMKNIYSILCDKTEIAIARARKQHLSYGALPPSQCCPATRVYELVEELKQYL